MINENYILCCHDSRSKKIFSSNEYQWNICEKCDLIFQSESNHKIKDIKKIQFNNFEEANESGKFEFFSILNKLKKYTKLSDLSYFDFGCADGSYLEIAKEYFKKTKGYEPNILLQKKALEKKLDLTKKDIFYDEQNYYDVIFTRNTFEYVNNFSNTLKKLIEKLNIDGYFIWRDKYYDYFPKKYSDTNFSSSFNSLPTKNAIRHHLSINQIEILESRFYFDKSFLIIGQKKKHQNVFKKKINFNKIFYNNRIMCTIAFYLTSKINILYIFIRKIKNFF